VTDQWLYRAVVDFSSVW